MENSFFCRPPHPSDSEEIVNLIHTQKNKSTDLVNIPVFIYKILAPLISPSFQCSLIALRLNVFFRNDLKQQKKINIFKYGDSILPRNIDLFPRCLSCGRYLKN